MATPVIMPKQGQSVETCIITTWLKTKGEVVRTGDILFSYETDKAAFEMESPAGGTLLDIFYDEGAEVPVLENVAVIGSEGEETESFRPGKAALTGITATSLSGADKTTASDTFTVNNEILSRDNGKIRISPRAKRLAGDKEVDYGHLSGSGPNGRIIVKDIETALLTKSVKPEAGSPKPEAGFTDHPLTNVRKIIAKAMHASLQNSAQLTHHMSANVRHILDARKQIKKDLVSGAAKQDISLNDMICWCVIKALKKHTQANSHLLDDKIRVFQKVHLGLAVDTTRGLMVPAIKNADEMDLMTLSKELKSSAEACRKGNINPELLLSSNATFTVSNLGNYGVEMFTPVINLPQVCILGICTIIYRPVDTGNGIFDFIPTIGLSLTYDHRAIDGGPATLFLKEIKEQIESFRI
jgi:pyruvate dehydrogenase E2 component (dihydrolipoamide acetyltransferase)